MGESCIKNQRSIRTINGGKVMKKIKISIIVPVFNVENELEKCIESLINQTYKNIEIILVDDGSTDKCPIICDDYQKKDNRIKVIHKENGGLSDARNYGVAKATGCLLIRMTIYCKIHVKN